MLLQRWRRGPRPGQTRVAPGRSEQPQLTARGKRSLQQRGEFGTHPEGARGSHPPPHPASEAPARSLVGQQLNVPPRPGAEAPTKPPGVSGLSWEIIHVVSASKFVVICYSSKRNLIRVSVIVATAVLSKFRGDGAAAPLMHPLPLVHTALSVCSAKFTYQVNTSPSKYRPPASSLVPSPQPGMDLSERH